jgi:hypothetical protein
MEEVAVAAKEEVVEAAKEVAAKVEKVTRAARAASTVRSPKRARREAREVTITTNVKMTTTSPDTTTGGFHLMVRTMM